MRENVFQFPCINGQNMSHACDVAIFNVFFEMFLTFLNDVRTDRSTEWICTYFECHPKNWTESKEKRVRDGLE
jgi:hypothetical protein